jgi:hypothetical protein
MSKFCWTEAPGNHIYAMKTCKIEGGEWNEFGYFYSFDSIRNCHMHSDVNEMRMLFSQLKERYANITFECVLEYFKVIYCSQSRAKLV